MDLGKVDLGVANLHVSRVGFGTSKLFRLYSSRDRQRVLEAAFDAGISHFDTARMYGLGMAEQELGRFLARHRGEVTVATKFGIPVSTTGSLLRPIQGLVRRVVGAIPRLQKNLRKRPSPLMAGRCFDIATAQKSLEASLRNLSVESIDIYFLHEPNPQSDIPAEMEDFLAAACDRGEIKAWGVSGRLSEVRPVYETRPGLVQVLQHASDVLSRETECDPLPLPTITYAPFANCLEVILGTLSSSQAAADAWKHDVGISDAPESVAAILLAESLGRRESVPVVFSTTRASGIDGLLGTAYRLAKNSATRGLTKWVSEFCLSK